VKPPAGLVAELRCYDHRLRLRWWPTSEEWVIEQVLPPRDPDLLLTLQREHVDAVAIMRDRLRLALPGSPSHRALARQIDAVQSALAGYRAVMFIPSTLVARTDLVLRTLRENDLEHRPTVEDFNRDLDEQAAAILKEKDKERRDYAGNVARDTFERIAWLDGRRITTSDFAEGAATSDVVTEHPGFTVRVRRGVHAGAA
jgi:hypothetical protein